MAKEDIAAKDIPVEWIRILPLNGCAKAVK